MLLWSGHHARPSFWASRLAYPTEVYLHNWDTPLPTPQAQQPYPAIFNQLKT